MAFPQVPGEIKDPPNPDYFFHPRSAPYVDAIVAAGKQEGVPARLLGAVFNRETGGYDPEIINGNKISPAGAVGIAQFMPIHWRNGEFDPKDPWVSIPRAAKYLREQYDAFGSWDKALAAYNWGPRYLKENNNKIPGQGDVKEYVDDIMGKFESAPSGDVPAGFAPEQQVAGGLGGAGRFPQGSGSDISDAVKQTAEEAFSQVGNTITTAGSAAGTAIQNDINAFPGAAEDILRAAVQGAGEAVGDPALKAMGTLASAGDATVDAFGTGVENVQGGLGALGSGVDAGLGGASAGFEAFGNTIAGGAQAIDEGVRTVGNKLAELDVGGMIDRSAERTKNRIGSPKRIFDEWIDSFDPDREGGHLGAIQKDLNDFSGSVRETVGPTVKTIREAFNGRDPTPAPDETGLVDPSTVLAATGNPGGSRTDVPLPPGGVDPTGSESGLAHINDPVAAPTGIQPPAMVSPFGPEADGIAREAFATGREDDLRSDILKALNPDSRDSNKITILGKEFGREAFLDTVAGALMGMSKAIGANQEVGPTILAGAAGGYAGAANSARTEQKRDDTLATQALMGKLGLHKADMASADSAQRDRVIFAGNQNTNNTQRFGIEQRAQSARDQTAATLAAAAMRAQSGEKRLMTVPDADGNWIQIESAMAPSFEANIQAMHIINSFPQDFGPLAPYMSDLALIESGASTDGRLTPESEKRWKTELFSAQNKLEPAAQEQAVRRYLLHRVIQAINTGKWEGNQQNVGAF